MNNAIAWAEADRSDRHEVQNFTCTPPGKRQRVAGRYQLVADHPSEVVIQSTIRREMKPPCRGPREYAVVGRDAEGIAALGFMTAHPGYAEFEIRAVAVALRLRRSGARVGDMLLDHLLNEATARALGAGVRMMGVYAHIASDNVCSQKLFRRFGFGCLGEFSDVMDVWGARIPIAGAD